MNGRTKLPIKTWREEYDKLTAERFLLCDKFYSLKDEVKSVEVLRRGVESLMKDQAQRNEPVKRRDMEL